MSFPANLIVCTFVLLLKLAIWNKNYSKNYSFDIFKTIFPRFSLFGYKTNKLWRLLYLLHAVINVVLDDSIIELLPLPVTGLPLHQHLCKRMLPSAVRGTRTGWEHGFRDSLSTSPSSGSGLTCAPFLQRRWSAKGMESRRPSTCKFVAKSQNDGQQ